MLRTIKRLGGFPCCHRQWKDDGHCSLLHGYDRWVELEWEGPRDHRGWVVDFASLKRVRQALEHQFDHTCLIAPDDPEMETWCSLSARNAMAIRIMDPTMEGMCLWVRELVEEWTAAECQPGVRLIRVTCWENEKNASSWEATPK